MSERSPKVFINYAREDAETAQRLFKDLKSAGADPWLDKESLLPGQRWSDVIHEAIRSSDFFLALLSSTSLGKRGFVQKEVREALAILEEVPEGDIYLLPARLDDCRPENRKMQELNWVDLFPSYRAGLDKILRVVIPSVARSVAATANKDESDLANQGWAVIFSEKQNVPAIRSALQPLLNMRREQATQRNENLYREFTGSTAYQPGTSYSRFLAQNGVGPGVPDPARVPSYLLIVGSAEDIPFEFQYGLSIQYRVGRLHFDTIDEYRNYAESLVSGERGDVQGSRRIAFFGPAHKLDQATALGNRQLMSPLIDFVSRSFPEWSVNRIIGSEATSMSLRSLLGKGRPDYIFSLSHAITFPQDSLEQISSQGAIVCSDWPGLGVSVQKEHYFDGSEIDLTADLRGLQLFLFAEYSAATPSMDDFSSPPVPLTARPFVSPLVKRLLGKPKGAAAVLGHVGNLWAYSFSWPSAGPQIQTFVNAVGAALSGLPVGLALKNFSLRYAELAAMQLAESTQSQEARYRQIALIDSRNYVIIGDPAARLPVQD